MEPRCSHGQSPNQGLCPWPSNGQWAHLATRFTCTPSMGWKSHFYCLTVLSSRQRSNRLCITKHIMPFHYFTCFHAHYLCCSYPFGSRSSWIYRLTLRHQRTVLTPLSRYLSLPMLQRRITMISHSNSICPEAQNAGCPAILLPPAWTKRFLSMAPRQRASSFGRANQAGSVWWHAPCLARLFHRFGHKPWQVKDCRPLPLFL